ncbi:MAG: glucoamylase family protein [Clostridia bacterium]|nr:glucoamylase family protein [Clostridia bacterium]MDD4375742.1 glucoamylase family protein [Clostridia bacterium]
MQDYILPIYLELKRNHKTVKVTYDLLNSTWDLKMPVHSAGQWILDNMYIIEQEYTVALEDLKSIKINNLPYVKPHNGTKQLRVFFMANEIVEKNRGNVTDGIVSNYIEEYQKHSYITFGELTLIPVMLKCALLKFTKRICINIFNSELQKLKVERRVNKSLSGDANLLSQKMNKLAGKLKFDISSSAGIKTINTSYIEYMAFKLKDMGRHGEKYFDELKEETSKIGFTIDEAIEKEHNEITTTTNLIANGIISLKTVASTNWNEVIVSINKIDEALKKDYTNEYTKCDYKTKNRYRDSIVKMAKKYGFSEMHVAKKAVECSEKYKKHVGYFLIGDDKKLLIQNLKKSTLLLTIKKSIIEPLKPAVYILTLAIMGLLLTYVIDFYFINHYSIFYRIIIGFISFFFGIEIAEKLLTYTLGKIIKPQVLPRFNFAKTIDKEYSTIIAMPSVINSLEKLDKMVSKMEVTYLANRSDNMYYMLLGDCTSDPKKAHIPLDDEIIKYGAKKIEELNKKYPSEHKLFNFLYRKRVYSKCEQAYMGWERKRGALTHLNRLLLGKMSAEEIDKTMYLSHHEIPKVKYLITVDEDTTLSLNSAKELVAIISHPLNKPVKTKNGKRVKSGYGLIQPVVGLDIKAANNSIFSKVFGGFGGLDIYTNAASNLYQDIFKEAIFTGKGIYDIELFEELLGTTVPEDLILSHDLLEGSYMRAGLASDVEVQDGFPHNFIAYMKRNHRWYRGDMQIISWLSFKSPLSLLSKWKIFDNLRREWLDVLAIILLIITMFIPGISTAYAYIYTFVVINFGFILSTLDNIILGKNAERKQKQYIPVIYGIRANLLKMVFNFITIPYKSWITISAGFTSLYRMLISKKNLLEWTTAENIEKSAKDSLTYVYKNMWSNVLFGAILILYAISCDHTPIKENTSFIFGIFFIIAPIASYIMSQKTIFNRGKELSEKENKEILEVAYDTWKYFDVTMTELNNYLPPDNIQENRRPKVVNRTSSTNIGFGLMAIINAHDFKFIDIDEALTKIKNTLETVEKLEKWNGHLLNWYNIRTLKPLTPFFVSTVDSGNFVTTLYVLKEFLNDKIRNNEIPKNNIPNAEKMILTCKELIDNTNFIKLYDSSKNIFSIGFDVDKDILVKSYYDILMSESRLASFVAIASRQVTSKHWFSLARNLISVDSYKGLLSWTGTSFEYFMPNLFTKSHKHTLIDEALHFASYSQMKYGKSANVPWGVSESAFAMQDNMQNYQYKAFGVPWLGLKRGLNDNMVVSPYSSILCLSFTPKKVYQNMKELKKYNAYSTYGFYEAIDFTKAHIGKNKKYEVVKTYMAHHQGMILTAINNYLNKNIVQKRFHSDPDIKAASILLKERVPMGVTIKENINNKYNKFTEPSIEEYTSHISYTDKTRIGAKNEREMNIQTNGRMLTMSLDTGENFMYYNNYAITKNRFADRNSLNGNTVIFTDKNTGKKWSGTYEPNYTTPEKYNALFNLSASEFYRKDEDIETFCRMHITPEHNVEIRKYTLVNHSDERKEIVIQTSLELAMCEEAANIVHPAFNNLKIEINYDKDLDVLIAKHRSKTDKAEDLFVFSKLIGIDLGIDMETEKSKLLQNEGANAFSGKISNYPLAPVMAYRARILLDPGERQSFYYIVGASEDKYSASHAIVNLDKEGIEETYKFMIQKEIISARYLKLKKGMAHAYNRIIHDVFFGAPIKRMSVNSYWDKPLKQSMLWKFSVSGDLPIIQVPIGRIEDTALIDEMVNFMDYAKYRKIDLDIVLLVDENPLTGEPIKKHIMKYLSKVVYMSYTKRKYICN